MAFYISAHVYNTLMAGRGVLVPHQSTVTPTPGIGYPFLQGHEAGATGSILPLMPPGGPLRHRWFPDRVYVCRPRVVPPVINHPLCQKAEDVAVRRSSTAWWEGQSVPGTLDKSPPPHNRRTATQTARQPSEKPTLHTSGLQKSLLIPGSIRHLHHC